MCLSKTRIWFNLYKEPINPKISKLCMANTHYQLQVVFPLSQFNICMFVWIFQSVLLYFCDVCLNSYDGMIPIIVTRTFHICLGSVHTFVNFIETINNCQTRDHSLVWQLFIVSNCYLFVLLVNMTTFVNWFCHCTFLKLPLSSEFFSYVLFFSKFYNLS